MLKIQKIFHQLHHKITIVILASLVWLITLPTTAAQADGYYTNKDHRTEINQPYYSTKERHIAISEHAKPYYSTRDRRHERIIRTTPATHDDYLDSGVRPGEAVPRDFRSETRQNMR
ncbi:hypothetical protein [Fortiea contorta]|uniref:hypothetical protein n=1 Tax=Fortiea contorta TaxID=1892405 RepID=UPI000379653D|nr:hypothetical protein [Fortiea contorta]